MATYRPPPPRRKSSYANTSALPFYPEQFDADQKYYLGKFLDYHLGGRKPDRAQTKVYFPLSGFGERSVDSPTHVFGGQVSGQNLSLAPPMPKPMGFAGAAQQRIDAGQQPPMAPLSMAPPAMPMGFAGALPPSAGVNQQEFIAPSPQPTGVNQMIPEAAEFWGRFYQSENDDEKKSQFVQNQDAYPLSDAVGQSIREGSAIAGDVFHGDEGIDGDKLADLLNQTAAHESSGGKYDRQLGGGPAQGYWQVEPETARDLIENSSAYMGPKGIEALSRAAGMSDGTKINLNALSDDDLVSLLRTPSGGAIFAGWKYLAAAKHASMSGEDTFEYLRNDED